MVEVKKEGIVLEKTALGFEWEGVLNPAVIHYGDFIHIFIELWQKVIIQVSVMQNLQVH